MKILILLSFFFIECQSVSHYDLVRAEWDTFKTTFNKNYATEAEEQRRMHIFMEEKYQVALHNKRYVQGLVPFQAGINFFSDMTQKEFFESTQCLNISEMGTLPKGISYIPLPKWIKLVDHVDWRKKGAVNLVKNQDFCGRCYSFSAIGALEGQYFMKTGKMVSFNKKNLINCTNKSCKNGWMHNIFMYIKEKDKVDTRKLYESETCKYDFANIGATIEDFAVIYKANETILKEKVATVGPISVAIYANLTTLKRFKGKDVFYDPECLSGQPTHAVLVVGYGTTDKGEDYWIVKNSWGTDWGDKGFFKLARNKNNQCGIDDYISYPLV